MHSRPSRPARWWARTLVLPVLVSALVASGGTAAYAGAEDTEPPSAPGSITVVGTTANSVQLRWAASTDNVGVAEYHVSQIFTDVAILHRTATNSIVITGMQPSRTYTFGVWAMDAAGNRSAAPPSLRFTMPPGDSQPPTVPSSLAVGLVGETTVGLNWSPSTDNVLLAQYEVLSITPSGNTVVGRVFLLPPVYPSTSTTISGLTPRTTYTFGVRAVDEAGNASALSNLVTVTTASAPEPPISCRVRYLVTAEWPTGLQAQLTIGNTGRTTINGWTLSWAFPDSQPLYLWGAELVSRGGGIVTVRDVRYNAVIAPGGTTIIGYHTIPPAPTPTRFVLNGQTCQL